MSVASERRPDLDALRVFACYLLFLFHVGMVFNPSPFFHVRNGDTSAFFFIVCGFIGIWHMPLFFLLAGWSAAASLQGRGVGRFVAERLSKLAVPLIAACVSFMPLIKYLELRSGQDLNHRGYAASDAIREQLRSLTPTEIPLVEAFDESFLSFLPTFFTDLDRFTWSHLWFVAYLLTFTIVLLPLLAVLARRGPGPATVSRAWIYAPILPLACIQLVLRERFPGPYNLYNDWANVSFFLTFLASGFAMRVVPALEERVRTEWRRVLLLGAAATAVLLAAAVGAFQSIAIVLVGSAIAAWCFCVAMLGFARERVAHAGPGLRYLTESAFPIYVLHQPAIVVIGAVVVALPLGIATKFPLLLLGATAATLAFYHLCVRPRPVMRFLLGMKPLDADAIAAAKRASLRPARSSAWLGGLVLASLAAAPPARAAETSAPSGLWWAEGGAAQVEIADCDDALCGRVVWLRSPFDEFGCELRDAQNPDPRERARSMLGIELFRVVPAASEPEGEWVGEIYDPTSGRTYDAVVRRDGADRLFVRGYLGLRLLGRTTTWLRVGAENQCRSDA